MAQFLLKSFLNQRKINKVLKSFAHPFSMRNEIGNEIDLNLTTNTAIRGAKSIKCTDMKIRAIGAPYPEINPENTRSEK